MTAPPPAVLMHNRVAGGTPGGSVTADHITAPGAAASGAASEQPATTSRPAPASARERHLDPDAAGSPLARLPGLNAVERGAGAAPHVHVVVGRAAARTARGQLLTWVTTNLLLRCFGVLDAVTVHCPDVTLAAPVPAAGPHGPQDGRARTDTGSTLAAALADLGRHIGGSRAPGPGEQGAPRRTTGLRAPTLTVTDRPYTSSERTSSERTLGDRSGDDVAAGFALIVGANPDDLADLTLRFPAETTGAVAQTAADETSSRPETSIPITSWVLTASAWKAAVVSTDAFTVEMAAQLPRLDADGDVNVAVWFTAAVGCAEVFKSVGKLRPEHGRPVRVLTADLWNEVLTDDLDALGGGDGPSVGFAVPAHWLAGAGAVGQAYLAVLTTSNVDTDIAVVDYDVLDDLNLNRHIVAGSDDVGMSKATLAVDRLGTGRTRLHPVPARWERWVRTPPGDSVPLPATLAAQHRSGGYDMVISAVDKNAARTLIAGTHPQVTFSASNAGLTVEVGRYNPAGPWQCLACASIELPRPTIEQIRDELIDKTDEELEVIAARVGADPAEVRRYLARPVCGTLGQAEVEKFAAYTRPDWSVSFVSVAAGTLLAARVLRERHCEPATRSDGLGGVTNGPVVSQGTAAVADTDGRGDTLRLWLMKPALERTEHRRRSHCPVCQGRPTAVRTPAAAGNDDVVPVG